MADSGQNNTDEKKLKQQADQIFNIAELPVSQFIAKFLEEEPEVIFKDVTTVCDPLILLPMNDYKKHIYIKFTLQPIDINDDSKSRIDTINSLIKYDNIKESIGFLLYCIKSVFPAVIASNMINSIPMVNIDLELDESTWVFYPKFQHELSIKKKFYEDTLGRLTYMKETQANELSPEMISEINSEYIKIIELYQAVHVQITPELLAEEQKINNSYANKPRLGIFIHEINKTQLPAPKYNLQTESALPVITGETAYDDV